MTTLRWFIFAWLAASQVVGVLIGFVLGRAYQRHTDPIAHLREGL